MTATASNSFGAAPPAGTTVFVTNKRATALSITGHTPSPSTAAPVLVTVSLSVVPPGTGTPTGTITVSYGGDSCRITLPAAPASCKLSPSSVGTKNLIATYGGDANFAGSMSAAVSHTVNGTTQTPQLPTPGGSGSIGVTPPPGAPPGCALTSAEFIDQQEVPLPPPAGYSFPQGLANFAVGGCGSSVVTMTVTYDVAISPTAKYYKYGLEKNNPTPHWYELTAAQNNLQINGNRVTFTLTDGGPGDDDLLVNGVIRDPGGPAIPNGTVQEFYNTILDNFFITADPAEQAAVRSGAAGPGWTVTGDSFKSGGAAQVCRFYGSQFPGPNSHFYTIDPAECQALKDLQAATPGNQPRWNFGSLDFMSTAPNASGNCAAGLVPVYRAYNNGFALGKDSNHRITTTLSSYQVQLAKGWRGEGVVMCAPQ
ncbi:MAG: Ig-like domain repeat protein [Betaproteobacteria bacterium]|nr:Ig-like domain repeat protein [Betaproteobacteria bacterium]